MSEDASPEQRDDLPGEGNEPSCVICLKTQAELDAEADSTTEWRKRLFSSKCGCTAHVCGSDFLQLVKDTSCMSHKDCPVCKRDMGLMVKTELPEDARAFMHTEMGKGVAATLGAWFALMFMNQMPLYIFYLVIEVKNTLERVQMGAAIQAQVYLALMPGMMLYSIHMYLFFPWTDAWPFHMHLLAYYTWFKLVMLYQYGKIRMQTLALRFAVVQYRPESMPATCSRRRVSVT